MGRISLLSRACSIIGPCSPPAFTRGLNTKAVDRALQGQADRFSALETGLTLEGQAIVESDAHPVLQIENHEEVSATPPQDLSGGNPSQSGLPPVEPEVIRTESGRQAMEWPG